MEFTIVRNLLIILGILFAKNALVYGTGKVENDIDKELDYPKMFYILASNQDQTNIFFQNVSQIQPTQINEEPRDDYLKWIKNNSTFGTTDRFVNMKSNGDIIFYSKLFNSDGISWSFPTIDGSKEMKLTPNAPQFFVVQAGAGAAAKKEPADSSESPVVDSGKSIQKAKSVYQPYFDTARSTGVGFGITEADTEFSSSYLSFLKFSNEPISWSSSKLEIDPSKLESFKTCFDTKTDTYYVLCKSKPTSTSTQSDTTTTSTTTTTSKRVSQGSSQDASSSSPTPASSEPISNNTYLVSFQPFLKEKPDVAVVNVIQAELPVSFNYETSHMACYNNKILAVGNQVGEEGQTQLYGYNIKLADGSVKQVVTKTFKIDALARSYTDPKFAAFYNKDSLKLSIYNLETNASSDHDFNMTLPINFVARDFMLSNIYPSSHFSSIYDTSEDSFGLSIFSSIPLLFTILISIVSIII
ncbi:hypothetical protein DFA_10697 [Cavenderia fasciculata]|uniref:Uncharacterized protein n=1 Tax=Cavenderia fasciculata TaxID=261658 RepID=F4QB52_CACFS|nr:uncharacterized protein DFA_10697 [Cavenderia fasciculata]EGG14824.1 hypothetical protein DFA_10697 [Cavenderia fasciculata]|eukprot:XP_004351340.1 hypothetical protein DFA_10697 [Cavenderia fasciculata]